MKFGRNKKTKAVFIWNEYMKNDPDIEVITKAEAYKALGYKLPRNIKPKDEGTPNQVQDK